MAVTAVTLKKKEFSPTVNVVEGTFDLDSSYPTGGETLTGLSTNLERAAFVNFQSTSPYRFTWDAANQKVLVKERHRDYTAAVDPASALTDTIADLSVTVTGVETTDLVEAIPPADLEAGVVPILCRVSAANTVILRLHNPTAGTVNGASKTWTFRARRADGGDREVPSTTDLSAVTGVRFQAFGA